MLPDLPELPEIQDHSLRAIQLRNAVRASLPGIPNLDAVSLMGYNSRAIEAARFAEAMRIAFEITRRQNLIMEQRAREADRIAQALAQRRRAWWR
jgi:hypothetical protein